MEAGAVSRGSGAEGVERNHLWPDPRFSGESDIARSGDLVGRMGLIAGEGRWLGEGGIVGELRGHQGRGRAYAGSAARPVVQPLEKLRGLEIVTKAGTRAGDRVGELLVGDVVREECVVISNNPGNGHTGPPGASCTAVIVVVIESCPRRFGERVGLFGHPGGITSVFFHRRETAAIIQNGIDIARVRWLWRCPAFPVEDYPASNQSYQDYKGGYQSNNQGHRRTRFFLVFNVEIGDRNMNLSS